MDMIHWGFLNARGWIVPEKSARGLLSPEEQDRMETFNHAGRRREYLIGKLFSRWMVLQATGWQGPSNAIPFLLDVSGKPRLTGGPGFSLAHADDIFMAAVGPGELGVDIEKVQRLDSDMDRLLFNAAEREELLDAPDPVGARIGRWVLKEAYVKRSGLGLTVDLRSIQPARLSAEGIKALTGKRKIGRACYRYALCFAAPGPPARLRSLTGLFHRWLLRRLHRIS